MAQEGYGDKDYCHFDFEDPFGAEGYGSSPRQPGKLIFKDVDGGTYLDRGFLDPEDVTIPRLDDEIKEGEERLCFATTVYSPSQVFLSFKEDFPRKINSYIYTTGMMYGNYLQEPRRCELSATVDKLEVGGIVIATVMNEWKRAKIVSMTDVKHVYGISYTVLLLDLGEYHSVWSNDSYYINKAFIEQPAYAFRTTLDPEAYEKYGRSFGTEMEWNKAVSSTILKYVTEKTFVVKFIRRRDHEGDWIWEISILDLEERADKESKKLPLDQRVFMHVREKMESGRSGNSRRHR